MIGLDSNVIVRILVRDDERQTLQAERLIAASGPSGAFVSLTVLIETVWVVESVYGRERDEVVAAVEGLLATAELLIEAEALVRAALDACAGSKAGFADALIGEVNRAAGCSSTATFDRKAARLDGFSRVP
jgi:predicted nucleic-acid-binding protein